MHRTFLLFLTILTAAGPLFAQSTDHDEFFEKKIRPMLVASCSGCHNPKVKTAGLDLTTAEGFQHGGESGALVSKENPGESLLLRVAGYEDRLKMPPTGKLKDQELADLKTWVEAGAPWPGAAAVTAEEKRSAPHQFTDDEKNFWAFQPVRSPEPPAVKNEAWAKSAIDRFILAKLEEKGLEPAGPTDKLTLLRRVTYDLTGLPPTETEIKEFLADTSPDAYKRVVERLLASPRYGEKWGRHWLDIARYADSTGNDEDHRYPYAWRYRDYVIEAFNKDLPYDQFVREQIAGDLLPAAEPGEVNRRGIVATGFLALGPKAIAQQDKKKMLYDVYDEQLDVMSKAIMGVTVACARCHDHKFDPFLTKDYYSLISIFASTKSFQDPTTHVAKLLYTPLVPEEEYEKYTRHQEKVDLKAIEIEDLTDEQLEKRASELIPRLAEYMVAARRVYAGGSDASAVAKEQKLREDVLVKWVKYLKPTGESRIHLEQWHAAAPEKAAEVAQTYEAAFEKQFTAWSERLAKWRVRFRKMSAEKNMPPPPRPKFEASKDRFFHEVYFEGPFSVSKDEREKVFSEEARARLAQLKKEHEQLKAALPPEPDMACAVQAGKIVDQKVFIRGDYHSLGEEAPKGFPLILAGDELPAITEGSGRLELAKWLTQPEHPLTSRVMANRIWLGHFGEGIVRTPDNFGKMGERPTHPELLDYLASQFVENGWSVKSMHRMILLSNTYQMSSEIADRSMEADPENKLFSRFPRRRLTVEEIRDGLLAIDNSINLTMGGTLQKGFGTDKENSDDRLSLRPETNRRRMVYLPLRRANLPTLLNLFDFGDATVSSGKRALTTVAPQALFMMNSDFVEERSKNLSKLVLSESDDASARLRRLYLKILNRMPEPEELDTGLTYVSSFQQKFAPKRTEADAWFSLSRILIASNDFIYLD